MNSDIEIEMHQRKIIQVTPEFLQHKNFINKKGQHIDFKCHSFLPDYSENLYFTTHIVESIIETQQAGYIILNHLDNQTVKACFSSVMDYFIHFYGEAKHFSVLSNPHSLESIILLSQKLHVYEQDIQSAIENKNTVIDTQFIQYYQEKLTHELYAHYSKSYEQFLKNWLNRPHVEMITVYNHEDRYQKSFDAWPYEKQARPIKSTSNSKNHYDTFRGQGIAQSLYEVAGLWMQSMGMHINSGINQTADGEKMWSILSEHEHFKVLSQSEPSEKNLHKGNKTLVVL